jgi:signal transduction histidine kinase
MLEVVWQRMNPTPLLLMLVVLVHLATAVLLYAHRRAHAAGPAFVVFVLISAAWTASVSILALDPRFTGTIWLARAPHALGAAACAAWVWFCTRFPFPSRRFHYAAYVIIAVCTGWFAVSWTPLLVPAITWQPWGFDIVFGPLLPAFMTWILIAFGAALVHLCVKARWADVQERRQIRYIVIGVAATLCSVAVLNFIIPMLTHSCRYAPLSPFADLFLVLATAGAILRHRLLEVRLALRNGLAVFLTLGALFLFFLLFHKSVTGKPPSHGDLLFFLLVAALFVPLSYLIRKQLDRYILHKLNGYRLELDEFDQFLAAPLPDRQAFCDILVHTLTETLHPQGVAVYLRGDDGVLELARVTGDAAGVSLPVTLPPASHVIAVLDGRWHEPLDCARHHDNPEWDAYLTSMRQLGLAVMLPFATGDCLCGLVSLGEKITADAYTPNDLAWLRLVGRQAAVAFAHLHQQTESLRRQERERVRAQFFSYISHELKNPLTPIVSGIGLLQPDMLGPINPRQQQVVEMIDRQARRLHHLIDDLLDLMLLENGNLKIHPALLETAPLITESVGAYAMAYADKGLFLRTDLDAALPPLCVDPQRFGQMLDNLLDNARKYTDTGGATVTARADGGWVRISVADTGRGLAEEELPLVFNHAYRAQQHHRIGGAGLGLAIVKHLAEAHGGTVSVASPGPGQGCTFTLALPAAAPALLPDTELLMASAPTR